MTTLNRRSFVKGIGLGLGAPLLGPIYRSLVSEAYGAPLDRKVFVLVMNGQGNQLLPFTPKEAQAQPGFNFGGCGRGTFTRGELEPGSFTWPNWFGPLDRWKNRSLIVDGLSMQANPSQHTCGYAALSCMNTLDKAPESGGAPAGPSIDQYIASVIGRNTPFKSLLYGASKVNAPTYSNVFSSGPRKPEPFIQSPAMLYRQLLGNLPAVNADGKPGVPKQRLLMDRVRLDIKKLQANLAGPERAKLDQYVAMMEDHEARLKNAPALTCDIQGQVKDPTFAGAVFAEDKLDAMTELGALALVCGATNVIGVSAAAGHGHGPVTSFGRIHKDAQSPMSLWGDQTSFGWPGHGFAKNGVKVESTVAKLEAGRILYGYLAKILARYAETLSAVQLGGKTLFDNAVLMFGNDNGTEHHDMLKNRWPTLIVGNAGGALSKVDGRYLRFGDRTCSSKGEDSKAQPVLADFFRTIAKAVGAETSTFGEGGPHPVTGPIPELTNVRA